MELHEYFIVYLLVLSILTYLFYLIDKVKAKQGKWRIPEKLLLGLSLFGGACGGLLAMYSARHKTKHWYFTALNVVSILLHIAIAFILYKY